MNKPYTFIILSFLYLLPFTNFGAHIIGGTTSYKVNDFVNGIATLEISFQLYRDAKSGGAGFDSNFEVGVFGFNGSTYTFITQHYVNIASIEQINFEDIDECYQNQLSVEVGTYDFEFTFEPKDYEHITFAHQRCCRNHSITNILEPEYTGMALRFDIFPAAFETLDQVAAFSVDFPIVSYPGEKAMFDISVDDTFQKEYELVTPFVAGGTNGISGGDPQSCEGITPSPKNCLPEFNHAQYVFPESPYGIGAEVSLDNELGLLNVTIPTMNKNLFSVKITRFKDSVLTSRVYQQFVLNTFICVPTHSIDIGEKIGFSIYPNPTSDRLHFSHPLKNTKIFSPTNDVYISKNTSLQTSVDVSSLTAGIYFLTGETSEGTIVQNKFLRVE